MPGVRRQTAREPERRPVETVRIDPPNEETRVVWRGAMQLAQELPDDDWTIVGGLMVQLHAYRRGQANVRPTEDIDVLGDSRTRPVSITEFIAEKLIELGFKADDPKGVTMRGTVYRFRRDGQVVDVLGPDGLKHAAKTLGNSETIRVGGGTQALGRTEIVRVELDGEEADLRCPNLLGAVLLKAKALRKRSQDEDHRDLALLLSLVEDPLTMKSELRGGERKWLTSIEDRLDLDDPPLQETLSADELRLARQTYALLTSE